MARESIVRFFKAERIFGPGVAARLAATFFCVFAAIGCEEPVLDSIPPESPYYTTLTDPTRSTSDRAKDAGRRPDRVLEFVGIEPGMRVADLMAGAGWYTEVLARVVGPKGHVLAQNSGVSANRYGKELVRRLENPALPKVEQIVQEPDRLELAESSFDAVFLVQFYHDTFWMDVDRGAMNRAVLQALKPGGLFVVIDHAAQAGSGARDVKELHRVDEALVREEILAAGFRLAAESDLLRNQEDTRDKIVFDPRVRGKTDRFLLKFVKP